MNEEGLVFSISCLFILTTCLTSFRATAILLVMTSNDFRFFFIIKQGVSQQMIEKNSKVLRVGPDSKRSCQVKLAKNEITIRIMVLI